MPTKKKAEPRASLTENLGAQITRGRETAGRLYDDAKDKSYKLADTTNRLVQEHPLAAAAVAVAAGAAIAALFPRVRNASIAPLRDLTRKAIAAIDTEAVKEKAGEIAHDAKSAAQSAAHTAQAEGAVLREKAVRVLADASKAVAARIDAEALKSQALDAAAKAGELASDMLSKASKAASEAAKKTKP